MLTYHVQLAVLWMLTHVKGQENTPGASVLLCNWNPGGILHLSQLGSQIEDTKVVALPRPVSIDYDPIDKQIYWTDVFLKHIVKADLQGRVQNIVLLLNKSSVPDGLALDIKARKLFYTDTGNHLIAVMDLDGSNIKVILEKTTGLDKPRAIVLDTQTRMFYWSDWGAEPYIATATYDGGHFRKIVTSGLGWPNGLAIDLQNNILYWCDALKHKIESLALDGGERRQILHETKAHYFDVFYYSGILYFTDWRRRAVITMPASGGSLRMISSSLITQPAGLHVIPNKYLDCAPGTYGMYCEHTCGRCDGNTCNNMTGTCPYGCLPGWGGDDCKTVCPPNTYGECVPCGLCVDANPCDRVSGYCDGCQTGWTGVKCDTELQLQPSETRDILINQTVVIVGAASGGIGAILIVIVITVTIVLVRRKVVTRGQLRPSRNGTSPHHNNVILENESPVPCYPNRGHPVTLTTNTAEYHVYDIPFYVDEEGYTELHKSPYVKQ